MKTKLITLILALLAIQGCAKTADIGTSEMQPIPLGATRSVTSFPVITPVDADYFIFTDTSNSGLFSKATMANTRAALGIPDGTVTNQVRQWDGNSWESVMSIAGLIDPTAGDGDVDKLWSADTIFDLLEGKQGSLISGTNIKTVNGVSVLGSGDIATPAGTFAFDEYPTYEDSAAAGSGIAVNATTLAVYSSSAGKWLTVALTDTLDPAPAAPATIASQLLVDTALAFPTYSMAQSFTVSALTESTITIKVSMATAGTTCTMRIRENNWDLNTYIAEQTFTPSVGWNSVQLATGALSPGTYMFAVLCDAGSLNRSALDSGAYAGGEFRLRSGVYWNITGQSTRDMTFEVLTP